MGLVKACGLFVVACTLACVSSTATFCDDGRVCPPGQVCTRFACALPSQIAACSGQPDQTSCTAPGGDSGECHEGVCIAIGCGNLVVEAGEACDDGNAVGGDGCSARCDSDETCGNAFLDTAKGSSPGGLIAVGWSATVRRFDGTTWSDIGTPSTQSVSSIHGFSANELYVTNQAELLRWDGSAWSSLGSFLTNWTGVWGPSGNDLFLVGGGGAIHRWNGTTLSPMTSGTAISLSGVWGTSSTDVFAVGGSGIIRRFDGGNWNAMTSGTSQVLTGVWGTSSTNVFAVGLGGVIRRYNGSSWGAMTSGTTQALNAVWGSGPSDIFAVGRAGTVLHFNGSSWSSMSSNVTQDLNGV